MKGPVTGTTIRAAHGSIRFRATRGTPSWRRGRTCAPAGRVCPCCPFPRYPRRRPRLLQRSRGRRPLAWSRALRRVGMAQGKIQRAFRVAAVLAPRGSRLPQPRTFHLEILLGRLLRFRTQLRRRWARCAFSAMKISTSRRWAQAVRIGPIGSVGVDTGATTSRVARNPIAHSTIITANHIHDNRSCHLFDCRHGQSRFQP